MNEKFNKNAKVEQLTDMFSSRGEEKGLIVKDPLTRVRSLYAETVQPIRAALTNSNDVNESFFGKLYAADLN